MFINIRVEHCTGSLLGIKLRELEEGSDLVNWSKDVYWDDISILFIKPTHNFK